MSSPTPPPPAAPDDAALAARLRALGTGLARARGAPPPADPNRTGQGPEPSAMARAFRLSAELVAGVLVGGAIGYGLDKLAGTHPWGFILFLFVGFGAGVLNLVRAAGVAPKGGGQGPGA